MCADFKREMHLWYNYLTFCCKTLLMRKTLITFLNVYFFINSFSQDYHKVDSLRQLLYTTRDDTIKGLTIFGIAREYMWTKPDTCLYYTNLGLDLVADPSIKNKFERSENPFL